MTLHYFLLLFTLTILLVCSIILSIKTRFIQLRTVPRMFSLLRESFASTEHSAYTIKPHKALFTAMSTTIGIGNIIGPLVAIGLGGPGAMLGFLLATVFGAASTFAEVTFASKYKDPAPLKDRVGGPMHYMNKVFPSAFSLFYAGCGTILMLFWSGAQANSLAIMLSPYAVPPIVTGGALAVLTTLVMLGGIKRVSAVSEALVPIMFILYTSAMIWIIGCNIGNLGSTLSLIWTSAFEPDVLGAGMMSGGLVQALRWGLAKGFTSNESGMGTATVPHSMAEAHSSVDQGILSIVSVFSNGILSILSGLAILMTGMHNDYGIDSITIITRLFSDYFPIVGPFILLLSATLFVISTLIGNTYNGSQFFAYSLGKKGFYLYYGACALSIFLSSMFSLDVVQDVVDFVAIPVMLVHVLALVILAFTHGKDLEQHARK